MWFENINFRFRRRIERNTKNTLVVEVVVVVIEEEKKKTKIDIWKTKPNETKTKIQENFSKKKFFFFIQNWKKNEEKLQSLL